MTPIDAIVWMCVTVFGCTAIITLLALIGVIRLGGGTLEDHRYYLKLLFAALILEVLANAIVIFYQETRTPRLDNLPSQMVAIERRVGALEKKSSETPKKVGPRWELVRMGSDCPGQDFAQTVQSAEPEIANCTGPNVTAVCWDGKVFRNGTRAWCTYKKIEPDKCVGGGAPGRLFRCVGS